MIHEAKAGPLVSAVNETLIERVRRAFTAESVAQAFGLAPDMPLFNAYETVAGATLAVTTQTPATLNAAGYGATSMVYTTIGEITDIPGAAGRTYATVEHAPITSRRRERKKGSYTLDDITCMMAWDQDDAGQDICRAAAENDDILTFKLSKQGGDVRYFRAQVSQFIEVMGTVDNVVQGQLTLLRQSDTVMDPV